MRKRSRRALSGQEKVAQAPVLLVWLADLSRIERAAARAGQDLKGLDHLECFLVAALDAAFAAQNAVVALEALGLGSVYIGGMRDQPEAVAAALKLPPRCMAVFGLCIGHPARDVATSVKPRLPQGAVVHQEQYDETAMVEAIDRHDGHYEAFRQEQGMSRARWSTHIMARVATPEALHGREHLRAALRRLGFSLR